VDENHIDELYNWYTPARIFIFNLPQSENLILTFNSNCPDILYNDIFIINRNYTSNTIYTLNGLNQLIIELNGTIDIKFKIEWSNYKNKFIFKDNSKLNIQNLDLIKIYEF